MIDFNSQSLYKTFILVLSNDSLILNGLLSIIFNGTNSE